MSIHHISEDTLAAMIGTEPTHTVDIATQEGWQRITVTRAQAQRLAEQFASLGGDR